MGNDGRHASGPRRRLGGRVSYESQNDWVWEENRRLRKLLAEAREALLKRPVILCPWPVSPGKYREIRAARIKNAVRN